MLKKTYTFVTALLIFAYPFLWFKALYDYMEKPVPGGLIFWMVLVSSLVIGFRFFRKPSHLPYMFILAAPASIFPYTVTVLSGGGNAFLFEYLNSGGLLLFFLIAVIFPAAFLLGGSLKLISRGEPFPSFPFLFGALIGSILVHNTALDKGAVGALWLITGVTLPAGIVLFLFRGMLDRGGHIDESPEGRSSVFPDIFLTVFFLVYIYVYFRILQCEFTGAVPLYIQIALGALLMLTAGRLLFNRIKSVHWGMALTGISILFVTAATPAVLASLFSIDDLSAAGGSVLQTGGADLRPYAFSMLVFLPLLFLPLMLEKASRIRASALFDYRHMITAVLTLTGIYFLFPLLGSRVLLLLTGIFMAFTGTVYLLVKLDGIFYKTVSAGLVIALTLVALIPASGWSPKNVLRNQYHGRSLGRLTALDEGRNATITAFRDRSGMPRISVNGAMNPIFNRASNLLSGVLPTLYHQSPRKILNLNYFYPEDLHGFFISPDVEDIDFLVPYRSYIETIESPGIFGEGKSSLDERLNLIEGDPEFYLENSPEMYDIIVNLTLEPWALPDSYYNLRFLRKLKAKLLDGGIVVQRINKLYIDKERFERVIATMNRVFRQVSVWDYGSRDLIVLCADSPLRTDYGRFVMGRMVRDSTLNRALASVGIRGNPYFIVGGFRGWAQNILDDETEPFEEGRGALNFNLRLGKLQDSELEYSTHLLDVDKTRLALTGIFLIDEENRTLTSPFLSMRVNLTGGWRVVFAGFEFTGTDDPEAERKIIARENITMGDPSNGDLIRVWLAHADAYGGPAEAAEDYMIGEENNRGEGAVNEHPGIWIWSQAENGVFYLTAAWPCPPNNAMFIARYKTLKSDWKEVGVEFIRRVTCFHPRTAAGGENPEAPNQR